MFVLHRADFSSHRTISGGSVAFSRFVVEVIALYNFESSAHLTPFSSLWQPMSDDQEIHIVQKSLLERSTQIDLSILTYYIQRDFLLLTFPPENPTTGSLARSRKHATGLGRKKVNVPLDPPRTPIKDYILHAQLLGSEILLLSIQNPSSTSQAEISTEKIILWHKEQQIPPNRQSPAEYSGGQNAWRKQKIC